VALSPYLNGLAHDLSSLHKRLEENGKKREKKTWANKKINK
jgi:hypothetical protein